jgi:hypothetical protein
LRGRFVLKLGDALAEMFEFAPQVVINSANKKAKKQGCQKHHSFKVYNTLGKLQ